MKSIAAHRATTSYFRRRQILGLSLSALVRAGIGFLGATASPDIARPGSDLLSPIRVQRNHGTFVSIRRKATSPDDAHFLRRMMPRNGHGPGRIDSLLAGCGYRVEITDHEITIPMLPGGLDGLRVVQMSDLHVGRNVVQEDVLRMAEHAALLRPDLLLLTGDFAYQPDSSAALADGLAPLGDIPATLGCYASLGNHDHWDGEGVIREALRKAGIPVLRNENRQVAPGLWLAALDDMLAGRPDLARTVRGIPEDETTVLMSHNPNVLPYVADRPVIALAGHTHGGQFRLPGHGFDSTNGSGWYGRFAGAFEVLDGLIHAGNREGLGAWRYISGWFREGQAWLYVNRGLGVSRPPLRYNCPAEMSLFRLRSRSSRAANAL